MGISIAALVLLVVLLVEHSIMQRAENSNFTRKVFLEIITFSTLEVVNWSVWLTLLSNTSSLFSMSSLVASAYFFVGFYIEHQITENVITQQPFLRFRNGRAAITAGVVLEQLCRGVGAGLCGVFGVSVGEFFRVGVVEEHLIVYVVGRLPVESQVMEQKTA